MALGLSGILRSGWFTNRVESFAHPGLLDSSSAVGLKRPLVLWLIAAFAVAGSSPALAQSFRVRDGWSAVANPNGPWQYGWAQALSRPFTLFTSANPIRWSPPTDYYPGVNLLDDNVTVCSGGGGDFFGIDYGAIRWQASSRVVVDFALTIEGYWDNSVVDGDIHLIAANAEVFSGVLPRKHLPPLTPAGRATLNAGQGIELRLGVGANRSGRYDRAIVNGQIDVCVGCTAPAVVVTCAARTATLATTPSGTGPFIYQWRKAAVVIDSTANPSAATAVLDLTNVTQADAGLYDCIVSNACGSVTSNTASLMICAADFNCDGFLDFTDFDSFVSGFEAGDTASDFNGDGFLDFTDFDAFVSAFEAGC